MLVIVEVKLGLVLFISNDSCVIIVGKYLCVLCIDELL